MAKGFSLIELLIATTLSALLLLGATSMFLVFVAGNTRTNINRQMNAEGQQILSTIEFRLRNARAVTLIGTLPCNTAGEIEANSLTYTDIDNLPHTLSLASSSIQFDGQALHSDFSAAAGASGQVFSCQTAGSSGKQSVVVSFRLTKTAAGEATPINNTYTTRVELRNTR